MSKHRVRRILATVVATCAMFWLVATIDRHGDDLTQGLRNGLGQQRPASVSRPIEPNFESEGLDLVDMYQCMCASSDDISQWIGWWLIAAAFGGVPTAILLRSTKVADGQEA